MNSNKSSPPGSRFLSSPGFCFTLFVLNSMLLLTLFQVCYTLSTVFFITYDCILLISMLKMRCSGGTANKKNYPFAYITVMTFYGITGKICDFPMVDAWPIAELIDPINGYEGESHSDSKMTKCSAYRQSVGKLISLIKTFSYLTPLFINSLMTIHRVFIYLMPLDTYWFSDLKLFFYSSVLSVGAWSYGFYSYTCSQIFVLITLLIPYYSSCFVNFDSRTSTYIAACAPGRHPVSFRLETQKPYISPRWHCSKTNTPSGCRYAQCAWILP